MIITKTPFRISFCGGGSDMPDFYRENGGCVISTSINKYMYISIHPYFDKNKTCLKYSENEIVDDISKIRHRIFKCVLEMMNVNGVEIVSTADVPSGTGLGSSSAFTVGLLNTLNSYIGKYVSKGNLAKKACEVEIELLGNPIGKQDQYASAFGGFNFITFNPDDSVNVEPIIMNPERKKELNDNLILFYTGITHDANKILSSQKKAIKESDKKEALKKMCNLARDMRDVVQSNDLSDFGSILHENWELKKSLSSNISGGYFDELYNIGVKNGATGGKILGAGGGGFMMFYCEKEKQDQLRKAINLEEFPFSFENDGTNVIYIGDKYW